MPRSPRKKPTPSAELQALLTEAAKVAASSKLLRGRAEQLRKLGDTVDQEALTVGVVGITSSGKSTFLNALMGEQLLPEESRATTNVVVRCAQGKARTVTVHYTDGRPPHVRRGPAITKDFLVKLTAERHNARNEAQVSVVEWTSPKALIPPGLQVVDTPGLDAYGHGDHEDITLRQFLPMADIVIYMTSIRNPFKKADLRLVNTLVENDQRVLFVLSQIDLERDSFEQGRLYKSRDEKLKNHLERLQRDVQQETDLDVAGTLLVSSKLAKDAAGNQQSDAWKASNFDAVLDHLQQMRSQLSGLAVESRSRRAILLLDRTIEEAQQMAGAGADQAAPDTSRVDALRADLADARNQIQKRNDSISRVWGAAAIRERVKTQLVGATSLAAAEKAGTRLAAWYDKRWTQSLQELDSIGESLRPLLNRHGVAVQRKKAKQMGAFEPPPRAVDSLKTVVHKRPRGFFEKLFSLNWDKDEVTTHQVFDAAKFRSKVAKWALDRGQQMNAHLEWWKKHVQDSFIKPLEGEYAQEVEAWRALSRAAEADQAQRRALDGVVSQLQRTKGRIKALLQEQKRGQRGTKSHGVPHQQSEKASTAVGPGLALVPLLAAFREQTLQEQFEEALQQCTDQKVQRVVFLGHRRKHRLRLLGALSHDLSLQTLDEKFPATAWMVAGKPPPGVKLLPDVVPIDPPASLLSRLNVVVAPDDEALPDRVAWTKLLAWAQVVVVELDAARISTGVSDVRRAPYAEALVRSGGKVLLSCSNGALFDVRLENLLTDVEPTVREHLFKQQRWFVSEDYDWRYTTFMKLGRSVLQGRGTEREFLRKWRASTSVSAPFTEEVLKQAFQSARSNHR